MKVFAGGASGCVDQKLTEILANEGHQIIAASMHSVHVQAANVTPLAFDFHENVETMAKALEGYDAVYFAAGSRGKYLLQMDAFGAVKLMEAADAVDVKWFVMLSSMFALEPQERAHDRGSLISLTTTSRGCSQITGSRRPTWIRSSYKRGYLRKRIQQAR